ncbi:MAG: S1 RNA-binding domain-containing protein [Erysipelothrix sp.]|nr:S1 RNA-binding domain-containing protein [Erysipelothrix sp.]
MIGDDSLNYKINDIVDVTVTGIQPYGVFVKLDDTVSGLLHISEISSGFVADISDYVNVNSIIKVKIIDIIDPFKVRVSLKALEKVSGRKRRRIPIRQLPEFELGFSTLEEKLEIWIKQLEEEDVH